MKAFEELKETTKKDIIIDGIMRSKGVYLLVSKPKVGKPLFALQLANSIANKKNIFRSWDSKAFNCLIYYYRIIR